MQQKIRDYIIPENYDIFKSWRPEQHFQRLDKYSNYLWEEFRLETWEEVIARATDTLRWISKDKLDFPHYQKIFDLMYRLEVMPSMRLLSMSQAAIERCNTVLYNCTSGLGDTLKAIAEAQYLSMSGSGVTWSVEKKNVDKIPAIKHQTGMMYYHVVEDTQIGWARATETLLKELARGNDLTIDYSRIRASGEPLKTKGGYASGPDILIETHNFIRKTLKNAQGRKLRPIEMHDMFCYALESGISGGKRRSAGMCIFDATDTEILSCKYDGFWNHPEHKVRANANNSAVWGDNLSKNDIIELTNQAFSTGTGEPNLFKRGNEFRNKPEWRNFLHPEHIGTNPSLRKGTRILTDNGIVPIEELQDKNFFVRNLDGKWSAATCFLSGNNKQLYKITLQGGIEYYCTAEHKWPILKNGQYRKTETTNILLGDILPESTESMNFGDKGTYDEGFFIGWLCGDGWVTQRKDNDKRQVGIIISEADKENGIIEKIEPTLRRFSKVRFLKRQKNTLSWYELNTQNESLNNFLKDFSVSKKDNGLPNIVWKDASRNFIFGMLDGLISSDGCVNKDGSIDIITKHPKLATDLLELFGFLGVRVNLYNRTTCPTKICDKNYNNETFFNSYAVTIVANTLPNDFVLTHETKNEKLRIQKDKKQTRSRTRQVISVEKTDLFEDVWDITVYDDTHCFSLANIITGNCGEISMQPIPVDSEHIKGGGWQFCNLSTINARHNDDFQSLYEKTKYATLIGDIQSLATNFDFLREGTKTICDKDRLLGVNLVGYAMSPFVRNNPKLVEALRDYTVEIDLKFAKEFNVPRSAAITAVKPSGNHSVLCYTAPGANPIHAETQIRNVTVNRNSAMHHFLESQGVPRHDYPGRDYASMFSFPIDYPEGSVTLENTTAIDQLEMWKFHKIHWCQHNPSISITYTPDEIDAIRQWLYQNQEIIGGLAFFPKYESSYELLPIVSVSKERYDEFTKDYPTISWKYYRLYETAVDDRQQVAECAGGQCVIV